MEESFIAGTKTGTPYFLALYRMEPSSVTCEPSTSMNSRLEWPRGSSVSAISPISASFS